MKMAMAMAMAMDIDMDIEKENICPFLPLYQTQRSSMECCQRKTRSPLPQGFPRSPLQDVTSHVLLSSPISTLKSLQILPEEEDVHRHAASLRFRSKRFKCGAISQSVTWSRLRSRTSLHTEIRASETLEPEIRVSDGLGSGIRDLHNEREPYIIQGECRDDKQDPSSAQVETSSSQPKKVNNKKRKEISVSVQTSNSSFANTTAHSHETKSRSNMLRFR